LPFSFGKGKDAAFEIERTMLGFAFCSAFVRSVRKQRGTIPICGIVVYQCFGFH